MELDSPYSIYDDCESIANLPPVALGWSLNPVSRGFGVAIYPVLQAYDRAAVGQILVKTIDKLCNICYIDLLLGF